MARVDLWMNVWKEVELMMVCFSSAVNWVTSFGACISVLGCAGRERRSAAWVGASASSSSAENCKQ